MMFLIYTLLGSSSCTVVHGTPPVLHSSSYQTHVHAGVKDFISSHTTSHRFGWGKAINYTAAEKNEMPEFTIRDTQGYEHKYYNGVVVTLRLYQSDADCFEVDLKDPVGRLPVVRVFKHCLTPYNESVSTKPANVVLVEKAKTATSIADVLGRAEDAGSANVSRDLDPMEAAAQAKLLQLDRTPSVEVEQKVFDDLCDNAGLDFCAAQQFRGIIKGLYDKSVQATLTELASQPHSRQLALAEYSNLRARAGDKWLANNESLLARIHVIGTVREAKDELWRVAMDRESISEEAFEMLCAKVGEEWCEKNPSLLGGIRVILETAEAHQIPRNIQAQFELMQLAKKDSPELEAAEFKRLCDLAGPHWCREKKAVLDEICIMCNSI